MEGPSKRPQEDLTDDNDSEHLAAICDTVWSMLFEGDSICDIKMRLLVLLFLLRVCLEKRVVCLLLEEKNRRENHLKNSWLALSWVLARLVISVTIVYYKM